MLRGEGISLRLVQEADLDRVHTFHCDIANRGDYFPVGFMSQPKFRARFAETGFWQDENGMLLVVDESDEILGHVEFFRTVPYLDEYELSYHIYSTEHTGKGLATQAVRMLTRYLFDRKKENRIRLIVHPDNAASKRVAEKSGYTYEGVCRGAWFHRGRHHDVDIYSVLRDEFYAS